MKKVPPKPKQNECENKPADTTLQTTHSMDAIDARANNNPRINNRTKERKDKNNTHYEKKAHQTISVAFMQTQTKRKIRFEIIRKWKGVFLEF